MAHLHSLAHDSVADFQVGPQKPSPRNKAPVSVSLVPSLYNISSFGTFA